MVNLSSLLRNEKHLYDNIVAYRQWITQCIQTNGDFSLYEREIQLERLAYARAINDGSDDLRAALRATFPSTTTRIMNPLREGVQRNPLNEVVPEVDQEDDQEDDQEEEPPPRPNNPLYDAEWLEPGTSLPKADSGMSSAKAGHVALDLVNREAKIEERGYLASTSGRP